MDGGSRSPVPFPDEAFWVKGQGVGGIRKAETLLHYQQCMVV